MMVSNFSELTAIDLLLNFSNMVGLCCITEGMSQCFALNESMLRVNQCFVAGKTDSGLSALPF